MSDWGDLQPAPIEFLHGELMKLFHEFRVSRVGAEVIEVEIQGREFNDLIARAKTLTYEKYPEERQWRRK